MVKGHAKANENECVRQMCMRLPSIYIEPDALVRVSMGRLTTVKGI